MAFKKSLKQNSLKEVVLMTTKIINNFNSLNSEDLSIIQGGGVIGCVVGTAGSAGLGFLTGTSVGTVTFPIVGTVSGGAFGAWSGAGLGMATFCGD